MPPTPYLTRREIAELLDLSYKTVTGYDEKGLLPEPDVLVGRTKGWSKDKILEWHAKRPGQGYRSDRDPMRAEEIARNLEFREAYKKADAEIVARRRAAKAEAS